MVIWLAAALAFAVWAFAGTLPEQARALLTALVLLAVLAVALRTGASDDARPARRGPRKRPPGGPDGQVSGIRSIAAPRIAAVRPGQRGARRAGSSGSGAAPRDRRRGQRAERSPA